MLGPSKLPQNLNYNQIANINDDEFFFCITFPKFEYQCCICGLSLRFGVLSIGFFFFLCGLLSFVLAKSGQNMVSYISSIVLLSVYSLAFILILISAINFSYGLAYFAYILYCLVLLFSFLEIVIVSSLMLAGKLNIGGDENIFVKATSFFLFGTLITCFFLYCLWVIFCYVIHLKYNRSDLVCGIYGNQNKNGNTDSNQIGSNDPNSFKYL